MKKAYFWISTLALLLIAAAAVYSGENNLPPLQPLVRATVLLLYLNLFIAYLLLVRDREPASGGPKSWLWMIPALGALCFMHPVFSGDLMEYLIRGRMLGLYHVSPYVGLPIDFPNDLLRPYSIWTTNPDSYGPLSVYLQTPPALLFPRSVIGMIASYKAMILIFYALAVVYYWKITRRPAVAAVAGDDAWRLFAYSPLLIVTAMIDGHNDVILMALSIVSMHYFLERRYTPAFLAWTAAFLVKYMNVLQLPLLILRAVKDRWQTDGRFPLKFIAAQLALHSALIVIAFAPIWGGSNTFLALLRQKDNFYTNTYPFMIHLGLTKIGIVLDTDVVRFTMYALYLLMYVWLLIRAWRLKKTDSPEFFGMQAAVYIGFYLVYNGPLGYWYLIWALPWIILARWPKGTTIIVLYSVVGLLNFHKRMSFMTVVAIAIFAALWIWDHRKRPDASRRVESPDAV